MKLMKLWLMLGAFVLCLWFADMVFSGDRVMLDEMDAAIIGVACIPLGGLVSATIWEGESAGKGVDKRIMTVCANGDKIKWLLIKGKWYLIDFSGKLRPMNKSM